MTDVTRDEALASVQDHATNYVLAQRAEKAAHDRLKEAIVVAARDAKQTQETIADATKVNLGEGNEFKLSRQRISQIVHE